MCIFFSSRIFKTAEPIFTKSYKKMAKIVGALSFKD